MVCLNVPAVFPFLLAMNMFDGDAREFRLVFSRTKLGLAFSIGSG